MSRAESGLPPVHTIKAGPPTVYLSILTYDRYLQSPNCTQALCALFVVSGPITSLCACAGPAISRPVKSASNATDIQAERRARRLMGRLLPAATATRGDEDEDGSAFVLVANIAEEDMKDKVGGRERRY